MATNAVPSLTSDGWITSVDKKCDRLLMNAFASDASQSNIFKNNVTSIQAIIYEAGQNVRQAGDNIARSLEKMYGHHFDAATFRATVTQFEDQSGRYDIAIQGTVIQAMRKYDFGRVLESVNGMITKFMTDKGDVMWTNSSMNL